MKQRVQQIITFEIDVPDPPIREPIGVRPSGEEIFDGPEPEGITEGEADEIVELAADCLLLPHAEGGVFQPVHHERLGPVEVRFVECKAEPLTQLNEDRRLLRELVQRLQVQSAVLEGFIRAELPAEVVGVALHDPGPALPGVDVAVDVLVRSARHTTKGRGGS